MHLTKGIGLHISKIICATSVGDLDISRDCPNVTVCNNCGLPGHLAAECTSTTMCSICKESGHLSSECPNDAVYHMCGKVGHLAQDCQSVSSYDAQLCNNCKPGHIAGHDTNYKACKNCRKIGHLARECKNDPICNICSISGHVARQCPKSDLPSPCPACCPCLDVVRTDRALVYYENEVNQTKLWVVLAIYTWVDDANGDEADAFWYFEHAMR
ncbi:zinc finger protein GIS2-like protein [Tanacetum coccineum]